MRVNLLLNQRFQTSAQWAEVLATCTSGSREVQIAGDAGLVAAARELHRLPLRPDVFLRNRPLALIPAKQDVVGGYFREKRHQRIPSVLKL